MNNLNADIQNIIASQPITIMTNIRLLLHKTLYNNSCIMGSLVEKLSGRIDSLSINYNIDMKTITIKIKKTTMKRVPNFTHNVLFYYELITLSLHELLSENQYFIINELQALYPDTALSMYAGIMNYPGLISLIYNATCISDNVIVINL